jgi:hypothetical protein
MILLGLNASFLLYIYLFAMRQSESRQTAWLLSFVIWILFDVFVASTMIVIVVHVLIPSLAMRDLHHLKHKLLQLMVRFRRDIHMKKRQSIEIEKEEKEKNSSNDQSKKSTPFNAAKYLFVSNFISHLHPNLEQSRMIMEFSTPWPKRCYKVVSKDVKNSYENDSSSFLFELLQKFLIIILSNFLSFPPSLQDGAIHLMSICGLGYLIPVFMKLYGISPVLVIGIMICVLVLIHFFIRLDNPEERLKETTVLFPYESKILYLPCLFDLPCQLFLHLYQPFCQALHPQC